MLQSSRILGRHSIIYNITLSGCEKTFVTRKLAIIWQVIIFHVLSIDTLRASVMKWLASLINKYTLKTDSIQSWYTWPFALVTCRKTLPRVQKCERDKSSKPGWTFLDTVKGHVANPAVPKNFKSSSSVSTTFTDSTLLFNDALLLPFYRQTY